MSFINRHTQSFCPRPSDTVSDTVSARTTLRFSERQLIRLGHRASRHPDLSQAAKLHITPSLNQKRQYSSPPTYPHIPLNHKRHKPQTTRTKHTKTHWSVVAKSVTERNQTFAHYVHRDRPPVRHGRKQSYSQTSSSLITGKYSVPPHSLPPFSSSLLLVRHLVSPLLLLSRPKRTHRQEKRTLPNAGPHHI